MKKKDLLLVGFHFLHHSETSGYDQLAKYINCDYLDANKIIFGNSNFSSFKRRINLFCFEFKLIIKSFSYKKIHLLYTENFFLFFLFFYTNKIIATLHLPIEQTFNLNKNNIIKCCFLKYKIFMLQKIDSFIVLSLDEKDKLSKIFPHKKIYFIPHGIHFDSNLNQVLNHKNFKIAVVGKNYRDLETTIQIIQLANQKYPSWKFSIIGVYDEWKARLFEYKNVFFYNNLSKIDYETEFSSCDIHLLPVTFSTANNAILEAHMFGVPTIASNIKSIKDYSVSSTKFFDLPSEALEEISTYYLKTENDKLIIKENTIKESSKFNWKTIANLTNTVYNECI